MRLRCKLASALCSLMMLVGCASPIALHRAVVAYDRAVVQANSEELLLNVVRARFHRPLHFTTVPSVAATFDFRATAGIVPPEGDARGLVGPVASFSIAENPTVTMLPMGGEEFTQRLLTPMDESRVTSLLATHGDLNMLLRLVSRSVRIFDDDSVSVYANDPSRPREYEQFRKRLLHLAALHRRHVLNIGKVMSETVWSGHLSDPATAETVMAAWEKDLIWSFSNSGQGTLTRKRIMLTNYPPSALTVAEKRQLGEQFQSWPPNEILVHVHPKFPGGEFPILGTLQLRSLKDTLEFLAEGLASEREFAVSPDDPTDDEAYDAPFLFRVEQDPEGAERAAVAVEFEGVTYALLGGVEEDRQQAWSLRVFSLLYDLFQMTVRPSSAPVPGIAIAK